MLLQATADSFGVPVTEFADVAFKAELAPKFCYGCAVFLDTDRVNFQKEGFSKEEMLAGLAQVLPKNVWQYVVQIPRLAALGTQVRPAGRHAVQPRGRQGAGRLHQGARPRRARSSSTRTRARPARSARRWRRSASSSARASRRFIGIDAAIDLEYTTKNDEETVCHFCPNECKRTFIDTKRPDGSTSRYIAGFSCEKGTVESEGGDARARRRAQEDRASSSRTCVDYEAKRAFMHFYDAGADARGGLADRRTSRSRRASSACAASTMTRPFQRSSKEAWEARRRVRIGIPRVLNLYSTGPFFRTYFEALGIPKQNVVFSDETTEEMWVEGGKYGSIDPCFPSKVAQAHIHNLLFHQHTEKKPLKYIFFPILTHVHNFVADTMDNASCPIVAGAPDVMKAAFTKEVDFFAHARHRVPRPGALVRRADAHGAAHVRDVRARASASPRTRTTTPASEAWKALDASSTRDVQEKGRAILETVEAEDRVAILMHRPPVPLGPGAQPRHPGGVPGPRVPDPLACARSRRTASTSIATTRRSSRAGIIKTPLELNHVWPENYSVNSAQKVWAASFAAHHPNVVVLDLSSFKCGHDAPTYGLIDSIIETSKTPYAALHDIDANKPSGSIKIRVKTYAHALKLHEERLEDARKRKARARARARQEAPRAPRARRRSSSTARQQTRPGDRARRSRSSARSVAGVRGAAPAPSPSRPKGLVQLGEEDGGRDVVPPQAANARRATTADDGRMTMQRSTQAKTTMHIVDDHARRSGRSPIVDIDAELEEVRGGGAQAPRPRRRRPSSGSRTWRASPSRRRRRRNITLLVGGLTMAHDYLIEGGLTGIGYNVQMLDVPDERGAPGRQGVRQPRPVQPDVLHRRQPGEVPHHAARQARDDGRGHRQELRLPHRGRVRPLPLRHVRHRVPQGAPRRRLRRLPRRALPADGRPQAGDGRESRPRDEPDVLLGASSRRIVARRRAQRARLPHPPLRGRPRATPTARSSSARRSSTRRSRTRRTSSRALWKCKPHPRGGRRSTARRRSRRSSIIGEFWAMTTEGDGNYQLQRFLESEGAEADIQLVDRVAPLHALGGRARHEASARTSAAPTRRKYGLGGIGAVRRRAEARRRCAAAEQVVRAPLPDVRARGGPLRLPPAGHGRDRRRSATSTTTTISAAAKATWRSASSS